MSRLVDADDWLCDGFPRVSGDEPHPDETINALLEFSPRERG